MGKNLIIIILLVFVMAGGGYFFFEKNPRENVDHAGHSRHARAEKYYCPMHPQITSDKPGTCPICYMNLVKLEEDGGAADEMASGPGPQGYVAVHISADKQNLLGVKTVKAERRPVIRMVRAYGYVAHNVDLYLLQDEYMKAYTKFVTTYRSAQRYIGRRQTWEAHRELQIQLLETEHKLLEMGLGESDLGKLRQIDWKQAWKQPELLYFKPTDNYWILTRVLEDDLGYVDVGQEAVIEIPAYKETFKGVVRSVGGTIDHETRTVLVLIEPVDFDGELIINMLANVAMEVELANKLAVPREAVLDTGTRKILFVKNSDDLFEPREVRTEAEGGGLVAVVEGLKEGEHVIVSGNFLIDSESRLKASLTQFQSSDMNGAPANPHAKHGGS